MLKTEVFQSFCPYDLQDKVNEFLTKCGGQTRVVTHNFAVNSIYDTEQHTDKLVYTIILFYNQY